MGHAVNINTYIKKISITTPDLFKPAQKLVASEGHLVVYSTNIHKYRMK
jgi:hypothetical protein